MVSLVSIQILIPPRACLGPKLMREVVQLTNVASTNEADIPDPHFKSQFLLVKSAKESLSARVLLASACRIRVCLRHERLDFTKRAQ